MRILLVDDSPPVLKLLEATLTRAGFDGIHSLRSGPQVLDFLGFGSEKGFVPIDLVLMDIVMPGMDGIEICRRIKSEKAYEDTPVIMVTIRDDPGVLQKAFDAGASDYIIKPVRELELLARSRSALRLKEEIEKRKARERQLQELTEELKMKNLRLVEQVNTDDLTNIGSRHFFVNDMENEMRRAVRDTAPFSLLWIEVDFFREFEEKLGKRRGEECLKLVAKVLKMVLKRAGDQIARIDGADFVVFLPKTDERGARAVAETMRSGVEALKIKHENNATHGVVTVSVGLVSLVPSAQSEVVGILDQAEQALSVAKSNGHNVVESFQHSGV